MNLPLDIDDLTPAWFANALSGRWPGTKVTSVDIESVQWGTATKVFVRLAYDEDSGLDGPPASLVVKAGFTPEFRELIASCFLTEARFYAHIAPEMDGMVPRCWFAAADPEARQGVVLIENLVAANARFGTPLEPWSPELVATTLDMLATWHGKTWNRKGLENYDWLAVGPTGVRDFVEISLQPESFKTFLSLPQTDSFPAAYRNQERFFKGTRRMWEIEDASVPALSHGDTHVGNTYITEDGAPRFLDWQTVCLGPYMADVAYFLVGALAIDDRRANEKDLLKFYLNALKRHGGPALPFENAWLDYRRQHLHGLGGWGFLTEANQPLDRIVAFTQRYSAAVADHDTFSALGV